MKGILLSGGFGTRLYPATISTSKQLLPVAGRPLVLFPLCTLMELGIREICVITTPDELERFRKLLHNGKQWGLSIEYRTQLRPNGLAEAFIIAKDLIGKDPVTLILGDNLFIGLDGEQHRIHTSPNGGNISVIQVANPKRYGVVDFDGKGRVKWVREKPKFTSSRWAVAGLYSFSAHVVGIAQELKPSARGELEIVDVISEYHKRGQLKCLRLPPSVTWLDCGTPEDLHEASALIFAIEKRTGDVIGSPELVALRNGWINHDQFCELVRVMPACRYREQLEQQTKR